MNTALHNEVIISGANTLACLGYGSILNTSLVAARHFVDNQTCQVVTKARSGPSTGIQCLQAIFGAV